MTSEALRMTSEALRMTSEALRMTSTALGMTMKGSVMPSIARYLLIRPQDLD